MYDNTLESLVKYKNYPSNVDINQNLTCILNLYKCLKIIDVKRVKTQCILRFNIFFSDQAEGPTELVQTIRGRKQPVSNQRRELQWWKWFAKNRHRKRGFRPVRLATGHPIGRSQTAGVLVFIHMCTTGVQAKNHGIQTARIYQVSFTCGSQFFTYATKFITRICVCYLYIMLLMDLVMYVFYQNVAYSIFTLIFFTCLMYLYYLSQGMAELYNKLVTQLYILCIQNIYHIQV